MRGGGDLTLPPTIVKVCLSLKVIIILRMLPSREKIPGVLDLKSPHCKMNDVMGVRRVTVTSVNTGSVSSYPYLSGTTIHRGYYLRIVSFFGVPKSEGLTMLTSGSSLLSPPLALEKGKTWIK